MKQSKWVKNTLITLGFIFVILMLVLPAGNCDNQFVGTGLGLLLKSYNHTVCVIRFGADAFSSFSSRCSQWLLRPLCSILYR